MKRPDQAEESYDELISGYYGRGRATRARSKRSRDLLRPPAAGRTPRGRS